MNRKMNRKIIFILFLLLSASFVTASDMIMFYGQGCPHCAQALSFFEDVESQNPNLIIDKREVYNNKSNQELFLDYASLIGEQPEGVPTFFIDNKMYVGFDEEIAKTLLIEIDRCSVEDCAGFKQTDQERIYDYSQYEFIGYIFLAIIIIILLILIFWLIKKYVM